MSYTNLSFLNQLQIKPTFSCNIKKFRVSCMYIQRKRQVDRGMLVFKEVILKKFQLNVRKNSTACDI
jgi:hypothetical protein